MTNQDLAQLHPGQTIKKAKIMWLLVIFYSKYQTITLIQRSITFVYKQKSKKKKRKNNNREKTYQKEIYSFLIMNLVPC